MILVPLDGPGVKIERILHVLGHAHAPLGHAQINFDRFRTPASDMILGEGRDFEIGQRRPFPGRIQHCMRSIGIAERALEAMCRRARSRVALGKTLAEQDQLRNEIADSRTGIAQACLFVFKAAQMMNTAGHKVARQEIAQIRVIPPNLALRALDRAIQKLGALGTR